jgi:hypothetical protein
MRARVLPASIVINAIHVDEQLHARFSSTSRFSLRIAA